MKTTDKPAKSDKTSTTGSKTQPTQSEGLTGGGGDKTADEAPGWLNDKSQSRSLSQTPAGASLRQAGQRQYGE